MFDCLKKMWIVFKLQSVYLKNKNLKSHFATSSWDVKRKNYIYRIWNRKKMW